MQRLRPSHLIIEDAFALSRLWRLGQPTLYRLGSLFNHDSGEFNQNNGLRPRSGH